MNETPEQYTARMLGMLAGRDPMDVLPGTPAALALLVGAQPVDRLTRRPAPGTWSVAEILAHLADTETVIGLRVRTVLERPGAAIQAFDQDVWAAYSDYGSIPAGESLDRFGANRRANVRLLRLLAPEQLARHGVHSERGPETVAHIIRMWAGHDLNHLAQVEKILGRAAAA